MHTTRIMSQLDRQISPKSLDISFTLSDGPGPVSVVFVSFEVNWQYRARSSRTPYLLSWRGENAVICHSVWHVSGIYLVSHYN
ncbi:hypothetical protein AFLA_006024 [Aspergillus flavus NRRL3357]|nr:hypothetical protein AFLA_006024 [Aspergillus flavus NRRL3357]